MLQEERTVESENSEGQFLGKEKVGKLLFKFAVPCILSLLISALYNIVDQIFIGNSELGYLGNAATGIVFPILIISLAFSWCFGDGSAAFLSICQGKKDMQNAHRGIGNNILFTLIVSVVLVALGYAFREPLLLLFGATKDSIDADGEFVKGSLPLAVEYFNIILAALPIYMFANSLNGVIRADGSPKYSMFATASGAVVNIILDYVFIFPLGWGMAGAAWATVIGQAVSFIVTLIYFFKPKTFRLTLESFKPTWKVFSGVLKLGVSTFITQMSIVVISLVCNIMLGKYGAMSKYGADIPIAVISIETKVFTVVINIVVGIVLGGQPILGYNYGAKRYDRVRQTYKIIFLATLIVGVVSTLIFELCPQVVIHIFGSSDDALYMEFAKKTFRIFLSFVTFTCLIKMTSIFFQSVGQPVKATVSSLIRDLICFVPLVIILPAALESIDGILFASPIADIIAMCVAGTLTVVFFKKYLSAEHTAQNQELIKAEPIIKPSKKGIIVTISRQHGSLGKRVGQVLAEKLGVACYYKEVAALAAKESGLASAFISDINRNSPKAMYDLYLSSTPVQQAVLAQDKIIRKIADEGSCVIVGRSADYVLRDYENVLKVFIYAPKQYRKEKVMQVYGDSEKQALKNIRKSDTARASYYNNVSGKAWGEAENYDLCVDSSIGVEETAEVLLEYIRKKEN